MGYIPLPNRSVIALYGPDTRSFLQSIITNDINKSSDQKAIYSLLLTPQGKYLYDFFLIEHGKYIFLECENIYLKQIVEKLNLLKTYLKVRIKDVSALYRVGILFNTQFIECNDESQIIFQDPRHISLGARIIHRSEIKESIGNFAEYELTRIRNLIPDGAKDMKQDLSFPLQYLIDHANGIDFNKGCYIGQEVVNRMRRQPTLRKKLYLVQGNSPLPSVGTKVVNDNNEEIGELRSSIDNIGLALLYTEKSHANLHADNISIFI
ncbi:MAG: folate-binding protein [Wolbachia endosymbiont of Tyrophagus putrescentiae]|nr:folate-binding protein [Wolbachia endosymbiont of Tyrophagus putrescentiae]